MLFHSFAFFLLFYITFGVYWLLKNHSLRMGWLLVASIAFYAQWNPWLVFLILFTAALDFVLAQRIERARSERGRRSLLTLSICLSLGLLAYFKYTNFLVSTAYDLLGLFGRPSAAPLYQIVLPLGISFYTFETISYVVDVYRGKLRAETNPLHYALFLFFFPHLIAGPIVRPKKFLSQCRTLKRLDWNRVHIGARLFLSGLIKKAVIADNLALLVDPVFQAPSAYSTGTVWLAVVCYAVQVYGDFSGYSDMAIGAAHALGFKLPQNFDRPYLAANIAELWRRWHISLSTWLRDYLYFPLGGSRNGAWRTHRNLVITMMLAGLWHGAAWQYVIWGAYQGALLAVHRAVPWPAWLDGRVFKPFRIGATFLCWCLGLVIFRAQKLADAGLIFQRMLVPAKGIAPSNTSLVLAAVIVVLVFLGQWLAGRVDPDQLERRIPAPLAAFGLASIFLLALLLMPGSGGAFIYFQF